MGRRGKALGGVMGQSGICRTRSLARTWLPGVLLVGVVASMLMTGPALAQCNGAAPPYTIPAQNGTVNLDNDCAGVGGQANVVGDVDGMGLQAIFDVVGGKENWAINVTPMNTVENSGPNSTVQFNSTNGSVDNSGTIQNAGTSTAVLFNTFAGSVTNRSTGQILSTSGGVISLGAGGTVVNEAGGLIQSQTASGVNVTSGFVNVNNAGTIDVATNAVSGNDGATIDNSGTMNGRLNFFGSGTVMVMNSGTITGSASNQAIRIVSIPGTVVTSGGINAGAGSPNAITFDTQDDTLELQPGFSINGNALGNMGTDTLRFGGAGSDTFDLSDIDTGANTQQFRSFENFEVEGGTWNFTGMTTVPFTQTGGTLEGTGTFGDLTVNGGTVAPGNSIGTMIVAGDFTLGPGAIFEVEVNAAGQSDRVIVNNMGAVNLTGATLRVLAENGNYAPSTDYVIIRKDSPGAVIGTFATVTTNFAFLVPTVFYAAGDGNDVVLRLERSATMFPDVARTRNQRAVAGALELFPTDNPLFLAVLGQTAAGARLAFDALSGEVYATVAGTLSDDSRYVREAVLGRLMQASHTNGGETQMAALASGGPQVASLDSGAYALGYDGKSLVDAPAPERAPLAFWTRAYGAWGDFDSDGNAASADRDLGGFISGMDAGIGGSWRAGLATGASFSNVSVSDRNSSADVETYHLGGYVGGMAGPVALRGGGMWAWSDIDTSRAVIFPGFFERQNASYDADTGQLFGEIAYPTQMGGIALEPFGGLAFVSVDTDSFRERGGPQASLRGVNTDQDVGYTSLGIRAATTMMLGAMQVVPHISAAWLHAFDDVTPGASLAFATTGIGFAVDGVPLAEDSALLDAGIDFALGDNATAGLSYTGQYGDGVTDNGVKGRFTWLF